jgi:hypothetical protein
MGVTQGGAMRFEDLPTGAFATIGAHSRLRDLASLARTSKVGKEMAAVGKEDAAKALFRRVRHAVPAPYIYKYEGNYDPAVPYPGWGNAQAPGRNFNYVQALGFQDTTHSNPTFPQSWTPKGYERLQRIRHPVFRNVKYDAFESKLVDRGVGGPPYQANATADPYVILPRDGNAIPMAVAANQAWTPATIPRVSGMAFNPHMMRYNVPRDRAALAQGIQGDGVILFEEQQKVNPATDPQVHPSQPALMQRYQISAGGPPISGLGTAAAALDLT